MDGLDRYRSIVGKLLHRRTHSCQSGEPDCYWGGQPWSYLKDRLLNTANEYKWFTQKNTFLQARVASQTVIGVVTGQPWSYQPTPNNPDHPRRPDNVRKEEKRKNWHFCKTLPFHLPEQIALYSPCRSSSSSSRFVTINSTSIKPSVKVRNLTYYIFGESLWCRQPLGTC